MLAIFGLASCNLTGGSSGVTVTRPTVDQMDALEEQWGTKPKATKVTTPAAAPAPAVTGGTSPAPTAPATLEVAPLPAAAPAPSGATLPTTIDISTPKPEAPALPQAIPPTLR